VEIGYWLASEEQPPKALVENAKRAEDAGFGHVLISDHIHPWVDAQGHSPFVWG
jgi:alkanesulfonate monooxygenase SsuD/methylene tetrahydromethanopterin reductase-like flavin-dependent oxidoreductase (luciferase family)